MTEPRIIGIRGSDKSGKTSLMLSAPKPLWICEFDVGGFDRAAWRWPEEVSTGAISYTRYEEKTKDLREFMLKGSLSARASPEVYGAKELWYRFIKDYFDHLEDPSISTIGIDGFPRLTELAAAANLQELQDINKQRNQPLRERLQQVEYGVRNKRLRTLLHSANGAGKNLVVSCQIVDKLEDRIVGEKKETVKVGVTNAGWGNLGEIVDMMIETTSTTERVFNNGKVENMVVFHAEVILSGLVSQLKGLRMDSPSWEQFESLVSLYRGIK